MPAEDLKSKTPGPLDEASRAFVDRVASRGTRDESSDNPDPDPEIDDTHLPLDDGSDPHRSVDQASRDVRGRSSRQPDSDNLNDVGEDETRSPLP